MSLAHANDGYRIRPLRGRRLNPLGNACWPCIYSKYWTQTSINSVICINSRSQFITILCFCSHEFSNIFLRKYVTLRNFKLVKTILWQGFDNFFQENSHVLLIAITCFVPSFAPQREGGKYAWILTYNFPKLAKREELSVETGEATTYE